MRKPIRRSLAGVAKSASRGRARASGVVQRGLDEERRRAQLYLAIAGVMFCALDANGVVRLSNQQGCSSLGRPEREILGRNWFDEFVPQRVREAVRDVFAALMAGRAEPVEYYTNPLLGPGSEERIVAFHNTVHRDVRGRNTGILFSGEGVTDRERATSLLRLAKEEWERTFDAISDPVIILDTDFRIVKANKAALTLMRSEPSRLQGEPCYRWMHGTDTPPPGCPQRRLLRDTTSASTPTRASLCL